MYGWSTFTADVVFGCQEEYIRAVRLFFFRKIESLDTKPSHNTCLLFFLFRILSLVFFQVHIKHTTHRTTTQIMKMAMRNEDAEIDISGKMMGDVHMADLCKTVIVKARQLEVLNAKMNNIGPKGAASIATLIDKIDTLEQIQLNRNRISNDGAFHIARAIASSKNRSCLRMLRLSYNSIGDAGASGLANAVRGSLLSSLQLSMNRITDVGAIALFNALPSMKSLKTLYLNGNPGITDLSTSVLAESLPLNISVRLVRLDDCGITFKGVHTLHDAVLENSKRGGVYLCFDFFFFYIRHTHTHKLFRSCSRCDRACRCTAA